jgi:hypothetical protein
MSTRPVPAGSAVVVPFDPHVAAVLRHQPGAVVRVVAEQPGYPCRQCLRDAAVGEAVVLVSFDPFGPAGSGPSCPAPGSPATPYQTTSPIFLHRRDCETERDTSALPAQLASRQLSVRAFDAGEMMVDAAVTDGVELIAVATAMFEHAAVDHIHVHNAAPGCWAARLERAPAPDAA